MNKVIVQFETEAPYSDDEIKDFLGAFGDFLTEFDGDAEVDSVEVEHIKAADIPKWEFAIFAKVLDRSESSLTLSVDDSVSGLIAESAFVEDLES